MNTYEGRPRPYIGVSGVVKQEHVEPTGLIWHEWQHQFLQAHTDRIGMHDEGRLLALGVKATHKTQFEDIENKYGRDWYPVGEEEFAKAINPGLLNDTVMTVVQTYLDPAELSKDPGYFHRFMNQVQWRGRKWLQAVQIDMLPWHEDESLLRSVDITRRYFLTKMLLQCHGPAMEQLGPKGVAKSLGKYAGALDYVLFDASHGTGKRLDVSALRPFLEEAYSSEELSNVGFAIAGGLNARIVQEDLPAIVEEFPDISWDAEGQLHPVSNMNKRPLQMDVTKDYLQQSTGLLSR